MGRCAALGVPLSIKGADFLELMNESLRRWWAWLRIVNKYFIYFLKQAILISPMCLFYV